MHKALLIYFSYFIFLLGAGTASAQALDTGMPVVMGDVFAAAELNNTIYIGGKLDYAGPRMGPGVPVDLVTGLAKKGFLKLDGVIETAEPDGRGGWFLGGYFGATGKPGFGPLMRIKADLTLDTTWAPQVLGRVESMSLLNNTLYIGGSFSSINNLPRNNIGAVDATTGQATAWNPGADNWVESIHATPNGVYAGGRFTRIGGAGRNLLARLDPVTGQALAWNPNVTRSITNPLMTYVSTIATHNNLVYVGGSFETVDGQVRKNLVALDSATARATAWSPNPSGEVKVLMVRGNTLYVGGSFNYINGVMSSSLAFFNATTGLVNMLSPGVDGIVSALALYGNTLYIGGRFNYIGKTRRKNAGTFDIDTRNVTPWSPVTSDDVNALAVTPAGVYVGGDFESMNGQIKGNLAAIDAVTGKAKDWNPVVDGYVRAMAAVGNRIYVGGSFQTANGQARSGIAVFDAATGALTAWNPGQSADIYAIAATDGAVYLGGSFANMGGKPRNNLAAVDPVTGLATAWNPGANGGVSCIRVDRDKVYVGGGFTSVGGAARNRLAAVHLTTGLATSWNPNADYAVNCLALSGDTVYAGGEFWSIGGQPRYFLAAIDAATGRPTDWSPNPSDGVSAIAVAGNTVYAGGRFQSFGHTSRERLAALDRTTGWVTSWHPFPFNPFGNVQQLILSDCAIYVAGTSGINLTAFGRRPAPIPPQNIIRGNIFADANANCTREAAEDSLAGFVVVARPGPYFASTDRHGNYTLAVDTGSYTVSQVIPKESAHLITQVCPSGAGARTVRFTGYNNEVNHVNFANRVVACPQLSVSVASDRRRRCFRSNSTVTYRNDGSGTAEGVKIHVTFPRYVVPVGATRTWKRNADSSYTFEIGTLRPHQSGVVAIIDSVVCGMPAIRGLTQCTQVRISSVNSNACTPPTTGWDGSDIALQAACVDSTTVQLHLYNRGTGAMADSSRFRVYLDARLAFTRAYKLPAGDSLRIRVAAAGQTVRLEADQRPGYPGDETGVVSLEACGTDSTGQVSRGFVTQLPVGGQDPSRAVDCLPIVDSFDPNDKLVTPAGVTDQQYVPSGKPLTYTVRFQNTGTDVAYRVVVVDTLSEHLDVATLSVGAVSHPYKMTVTGKGRPVLTFTFDNIMLPDSNRNEPASHGYLKFSIRPLAAVAQGTRIENFADIFFDYNEPVRTNTVHNTVYDLPVPAPGGGRVVVCGVNAAATAGPDRVVCEQDTVRLQARAPHYGAGRWKQIGGGGTLATAGDPHALVTGLAYGENLFEWTVPANGCTTDSLRQRVAITRYPRPARPVVTLSPDGLLRCEAAGDGYRWYYNEVLLADTTRTLRPVQAGRYAVQVLRNGCASDRSEAYAFDPAVTGLEPQAARTYGIHPNPGTGRFYLVTPAGTGPVEVTLSDALGRVVMRRTVVNHAADAGRYELDLSQRPAGIYLAQIRSGKDRKVFRLVKK